MPLNVGDLTDLTEVYRDTAGELAAPATLEVDVFPPSATLTGDDPDDPTTYVYDTDDELTEVEAGVYHLAITVDEAGAWRYRWRATGAVENVVRTGELWVIPSDFDTAPQAGVTPTVQEVADVLNDRRVNAYGQDLRTFGDETKPSAQDAATAIARAERLVRAKLGPAFTAAGVSADAVPLARDAIALQAALGLVQYLPEEEPEPERIRTDLDAVMRALDDLLEDDTANTAQFASVSITTPAAEHSAELGLYEA